MDEIIQGIAIYALPVIFAITMHEAAHGYIAKQFGDFTAHNAGRISMNPMRHIDPVGTILVPITLFVLSKLTIDAGFYSDGQSRYRSISPICTIPSATCYGLRLPVPAPIY